MRIVPPTKTLELNTATRQSDQKPFVALSIGAERVLLSPDETRAIAGKMFDFAAVAEFDAATIRVLNRLDADNEAGIGVTPEQFLQYAAEARVAIRVTTTQG